MRQKGGEAAQTEDYGETWSVKVSVGPGIRARDVPHQK